MEYLAKGSVQNGLSNKDITTFLVFNTFNDKCIRNAYAILNMLVRDMNMSIFFYEDDTTVYCWREYDLHEYQVHYMLQEELKINTSKTKITGFHKKHIDLY